MALIIIALFSTPHVRAGDGVSIIEKARAFLAKAYEIDAARYELSPKLPPGAYDDLTSMETTFPRYGKYWVAAEFREDGRLRRTLIIKFRLLARLEVARALRDVNARSAVTSECAELITMGVDTDAVDPECLVTSLDYLKGKRARYLIRRGALLRKDRLETIPPVIRNESVRVVITRGELVVELQAIAVEDGRPGGQVKVRLENGKVLRGTVGDQGAVHILQ
jgi:flagella basal body P-ring formation protein FlgA